MVQLTLYHNPRCSKSREALALLTSRGVAFDVRRYLDAPLSREELETLAQRLGNEASRMLRHQDSQWQETDITSLTREQILAAIAESPRLLERPILDNGHHAVIGRPPQAVLQLL
ncbi:arsenate reductase (glutaredoxin) [Salinicola avicenniae]|uniref:arsenate reductase (glutaredoxin) n=1 Tax=Salinicola avicenniae TaxID=2916836 RepID=UPI0020743FDA|nr:MULTISPECIES: arsenate reductase (glutaredoxin) [unclassified Salinicola]